MIALCVVLLPGAEVQGRQRRAVHALVRGQRHDERVPMDGALGVARIADEARQTELAQLGELTGREHARVRVEEAVTVPGPAELLGDQAGEGGAEVGAQGGSLQCAARPDVAVSGMA
jgi:hypothetical protein